MRTHSCSRTARWLAAGAAAVLVLTGCAGDDPSTVDGATDAPGSEVPADGSDGDAQDDNGADAGGDTGADDVDGEAVGEVPPLLDVVDDWPETTVTLEGDAPTTVAAKVADDTERRQQGLMNVEVLPDGVGMLFLFEELRTGGFWMKDTLVPLDIAYIADGEVVSVMQMDPCEADPCPSYDPGVEYDAALEVNQGALADAGVTEGTTVTWTDPVEVTP